MKQKWIVLLLSLSLLLCACDGATSGMDEATTVGTTEATVVTTATTTAATTAGTEAPYVSQATSLFTLLSEVNLTAYEHTHDDSYEPLPGALPLECIPPKNDALIGKEMTVNLKTEEKGVYFYYCKNEATQTERLALVMEDGYGYGEIVYPLLIVADVNFGGVDAFKEALTRGTDFQISIVATANLCLEEGSGFIPTSVYAAQKDSNVITPSPDGIVEYFGKAGGGEDAMIFPRIKHTGFHTAFDRHSLNEVMGIYIYVEE